MRPPRKPRKPRQTNIASRKVTSASRIPYTDSLETAHTAPMAQGDLNSVETAPIAEVVEMEDYAFSDISETSVEPVEKIVSLAKRRKERKQDQRRITWRRILILLGMLVFIALLIWTLFFSPLLRISPDKVGISGVKAETPVYVDTKNVLAEYSGKQLLLIKRSALSRRIEEIPEVNRANLRILPTRGLTVDLVLEKPLVCKPMHTTCVPLSRKGEKLRLDTQSSVKLPKLTAISSTVSTSDAMIAIEQVFQDIGTDLKAQVAKVSVETGAQITFVLQDGRSVFWGTKYDGTLKAKVLCRLLSEPKTKFDVSIPTVPVGQ